jgi:hypothetical protein
MYSPILSKPCPSPLCPPHAAPSTHLPAIFFSPSSYLFLLSSSTFPLLQAAEQRRRRRGAAFSECGSSLQARGCGSRAQPPSSSLGPRNYDLSGGALARGGAASATVGCSWLWCVASYVRAQHAPAASAAGLWNAGAAGCCLLGGGRCRPWRVDAVGCCRPRW